MRTTQGWRASGPTTALQRVALERRDLRPDDLAVRVDYCGVCYTDLHAIRTHTGDALLVPGHEFTGVVTEVGRDVTGWREGQPVAASPLGSCGKCRICARGLAFRCEAAPNIGITRQGAYAQYVAVPARQLAALPEELPVETGSHAALMTRNGLYARLAKTQDLESGAETAA